MFSLDQFKGGLAKVLFREIWEVGSVTVKFRRHQWSCFFHMHWDARKLVWNESQTKSRTRVSTRRAELAGQQERTVRVGERESHATAHRQETRDRKQVQTEPGSLSHSYSCIPALRSHGKPFHFNEVSLICQSTSSSFCYCNHFQYCISKLYVVVPGHLSPPPFFHLVQKGRSPSTTSCKSRNNDLNKSST